MALSYTSKVFLFITLVILFLTGCHNNQKESEIVEQNIQKLFEEDHRPQFHFTPKANWMNDPNGMFYFEKEYHLFYQYYPDSTVWGPMHWGHATSKDLVHWKHLPIALFPDSIGCIFSGGAVVDHHNTSKLGTETNPPIVATFTHHDFVGEKARSNDFQKQSLAYSLNGGLSWEKYKGNPVIANTKKIKDFRDPKVVWHEDSQKWILVLAAYDRVKFYASANLIDWEYLSDFGIKGDDRLWECPDLFPMKVEGTEETKWVLIVSIQQDAPNKGSATSYFVGDFNGKEFNIVQQDQKWLDWGPDNYAFVTWNNLPKKEDRIIGIGWMSNWQYAQIVPTETWRSAMTLPRELSLVRSDSNYVVHSLPVKEIESLRRKSISFNPLNIREEKVLGNSFNPSQAELDLFVDLKKTTSNSFGIKLQNDVGEYLTIQFNKSEGKMYVDRTNSSQHKFSEEFFHDIHNSPVNFDKENMHIRLFIDVASAEIFIDQGELNFTSIFFPSKDFDKISLFADNGAWHITQFNLYQLAGIWDKNKEEKPE